MKTLEDLSSEQLPLKKRLELEEITEVIKRVGGDHIKMIILFGSYACGRWVEDTYTKGHLVYSYHSDFDLLLVVDSKKMEENEGLLHEIESQIYEIKGLSTLATLIIHSIGFINKQLEKGQYFYADVKRDGVVLYDSGEYELAEPKKLTPAEQRRLAQGDFDFWFESAEEFLDFFSIAVGKERLRKAAFFLHQATEAFFVAFLLVFGGYRPKCHNLKKLHQMTEEHDIQIKHILFPGLSEHEYREFDLLNAAYVDARFEESYVITKEQLESLYKRVEGLGEHVRQMCEGRIAKLG